jgi:hypothetical protein
MRLNGLARLLQKKSYNPAATILRIYSKEGLEGLYAGLSSSLFGIGVTNAVYCSFPSFISCRPDAEGPRG